MSRRKNSGYLIEVIEGVNKGKKGYCRHADQTQEITGKGKILVTLANADYTPVEGPKVLINAKFCIIKGFYD